MKKFQSIQVRRPKRSAFDLSHEKKLSCNMGDLIPVYLEPIIPGDKFKVSSEILVRLAPMLAPMMHRVNVFTHYFFVPNRLTWDNWETFITGGESGEETANFPRCTMRESDETWFQKGSLADYMGLPIMDPDNPVTQNVSVSALPFRAYTHIYNEYYRDQNLEEPVNFGTGDTMDGDYQFIMSIRKRAWEKDYFTSALPWPQRGGEVGIPVSFQYKDASELYLSTGEPMDDLTDYLASNNDGLLSSYDGVSVKVPGRVENLADESAQVSINELRKAARLQEWLEKNARAGSRYIEQILSHFGVRSSDSRLQRPEYLGGGRQAVTISEVIQQSATVIDGGDPHANIPASPQGNMAGHGISIGGHHGFSKTFEEHGYILGIMSILPRTAYSQGIERDWLKFDKFDFYWPEFAHLGEQEIMNGEIYADFQGTPNEHLTTWGYQSRYAEYKFKQSSIHGDFRDTLEFWHMSRKFTGPPALNKDFVISNPTNRVFAVEDSTIDHLYVQIYNSVRALRPMPYFGTPRL